MITSAIKWFILRKINKLLEQYKDKVILVKSTIQYWLLKLDDIKKLLDSTLSKLDDGVLDDDEVEQIEQDIAKTIKDWKTR